MTDAELCFDSIIPIPPGEALDLRASHGDVFRTHAFEVDPDCARLFMIARIRVGNADQLVNDQEIHAQVFLPAPYGVMSHLVFDTAHPNQDVTIRVRNISDAPARFQAKLKGLAYGSGPRT